MPGPGSGYSWGSSWTLRGGLRKTPIGGIGNVLVPRRAESGEDFAADWIRAIKACMLTATVNAKGGGGVATSNYRVLKASFFRQLWLAHLWAEWWWRRVQIGQAGATSLHSGAE